MGKGMRCCRVSRKSVAAWAVARRCAWITSQRETTWRAVNSGLDPRAKIKSNGGGQECPPYTNYAAWRDRPYSVARLG